MHSIMEKLRCDIRHFREKDAVNLLQQKRSVQVFQEYLYLQTLDKGKACSHCYSVHPCNTVSPT